MGAEHELKSAYSHTQRDLFLIELYCLRDLAKATGEFATSFYSESINCCIDACFYTTTKQAY